MQDVVTAANLPWLKSPIPHAYRTLASKPKMIKKTTLVPWLLAALLGISATAQAEEKMSPGDISRAVAYTDAMRAQAYQKQAEQFKGWADKVGPGQDGSEAMGKAVKLMGLANQAMRAACTREPHYVEKGIKAFRCSALK